MDGRRGIHKGERKVYSPVRVGTQTKDVVDTRWVLSWKEVDGGETVKARLAAKGYQDPDLLVGNVDIAGCVSRRPHIRN